MGCIPTFHQIGYWAPTLLVILRLIQGFAFGGEWGGAVILVSEHSPDDRRGYWASWPQTGVPLGNLVATLVLLLLSKPLTRTIPRLGMALCILVLSSRGTDWFMDPKNVDDAEVFKEAQAKQQLLEKQQLGIIEVLKYHKKSVIAGIGARFAENILYYMVVTFSISYLKLVVHKDTSQILLLMFGAHLIHFFIIPFMGHLSDIFGRKPIYLIGAVLTAFGVLSAFL